MKIVYLLIAYVFLSASLVAQTPSWSAYGGVPNAATRTSVLDASGNKWVTMFGGGISKFKPDETWDNYNMSNSGIPDNYTLCVTIDNSGQKWIGTNTSGAVVYNGTTWTTYNTSNGMPGNQVNCITIDASNDKWFGINLNGVTKYNGSTFTTYNSSNSSLPNNNVNCITIDANGNKWIGTYGGLAKFNGSTWTVYTTANSNIAHDQVYSIVIENANTIWLGTGGGLCKFDGNSTWTTYNTGNSGLPYNYVNCVAIDQNGTKWIGTTQGGMAKFDGTAWTVFNTSNSDIPGLNVRHISIDFNNNLWVCTNGGFAFYGILPSISTDATLSALYVNGADVTGFSPTTYTYNVVLPTGTITLPVVTATTTHPFATKIITNTTNLPGTATIVVTAEDGITTATYTIYFSVATEIENVSGNLFSIYPNPSNGLFNIQCESAFHLTISDITNKVILNKMVHDKSFQIDITKFNNGFYLIKIENNNAILFDKVIIQH